VGGIAEAAQLLLKQMAAGWKSIAGWRSAAGQRLAGLAGAEGVELIIVDSRGCGAFRAAGLGSESKALVGIACRSILIVPPGVD
jgi:hypothetical protein